MTRAGGLTPDRRGRTQVVPCSARGALGARGRQPGVGTTENFGWLPRGVRHRAVHRRSGPIPPQRTHSGVHMSDSAAGRTLKSLRRVVLPLAVALVAALLPVAAVPALLPAANAADPCSPLLNAIACENSKPGARTCGMGHLRRRAIRTSRDSRPRSVSMRASPSTSRWTPARPATRSASTGPAGTRGSVPARLPMSRRRPSGRPSRSASPTSPRNSTTAGRGRCPPPGRSPRRRSPASTLPC